MLILLIPTIFFYKNNVVYGDLSDYTTSYVDGVIYIYLYSDNVEIGQISIQVSYIDGIYPYDIIIEYVFYMDTIKSLLNSENVSPYIIFEYSYSVEDDSSINGRRIYDVTSVIIKMSKIVIGEDLDIIRLKNAEIKYTLFGLDTLTGSINLYDIMIEYGVPTYFLKELYLYRIYVNSIYIDPGWMNYEIYSGGRKIGLLMITSSNIFNNSNNVRFRLKLYDYIYSGIMQVILVVDGYSEPQGTRVSDKWTITPNEDIIIPTMFSFPVSRDLIVLERIYIEFIISNYIYVLNVTKDICPVILRPSVIYEALPIDAVIDGVNELGGGWLEVRVGFNSDIDITKLTVSYIPDSDNIRPISIRSFIANNIGEYRSYMKVFMLFPRSGSITGSLYLYESVADRILRRIKLPISYTLASFGSYSHEEIMLNYSIHELNASILFDIDRLNRLIRLGIIEGDELWKYMEDVAILYGELANYEKVRIYVLDIPVDLSLGFGDHISIALEYLLKVHNEDIPVIIYIEPYFKDEFGRESIIGNIIYRQFLNGSSMGYRSYPTWSRIIEDVVVINLYNIYSSDFDRDFYRPFLSGYKSYFINVENITLKLNASYIDVSEPESHPVLSEEFISTGPSDYLSFFTLLSSIVVPIVGIVVALTIFYFIVKKRLKIIL
jgi:hypothetical protein